jgi:methyl-accepting chemotaxis protein
MLSGQLAETDARGRRHVIFSALKNLSVRSKVITCFVCVLAATAALGEFSVDSLRTVDDEAEQIRSNWLPATMYLGKIAASSMRYRQVQAQYMLETTEDARNTDLKVLNGIKDDIAGAQDNYEPTVMTGKERELASAFEKKWQDYIGLQDQLAGLVSKKGSEKAAIEFYTETLKTPFAEFQKALDEELAYQVTGANEAGNHGAAVFESARDWIWRAVGTAALLSICIAFMLIRAVCSPLRLMTRTMTELAEGNLAVKVPAAGRKDEIGKLAGATRTLKDQLAAAEKSKSEQTQIIVSGIGSGLDSLAKGDLTQRVTADLTGPFAKLKDDFNGAVGRLQNTMATVLVSTSGISAGANEISQAADNLSKRTEQQAASLEETAAALEQITATIKKTAQNAKETSTIVATAKSAAEEGGRVVETAIQAMGEIEQSSKKITDIIGVIDEIAFQTNLLALNAGVEAARAGDAGKGFAVVASEVRALAQRSGEAAKQIKTLIKTSGEQVNSGVKLVGGSGTALKRIADQVIEINNLVSEMAHAAQQQATGIEQVSAAVVQMDRVTHQNAAMVEESTAASRNLAAETADLSKLVSFFRVASETTQDKRPVRDRKTAGGMAGARSSFRKSAKTAAQSPALVGPGAEAALALDIAPEAVEDEWQEF